MDFAETDAFQASGISTPLPCHLVADQVGQAAKQAEQQKKIEAEKKEIRDKADKEKAEAAKAAKKVKDEAAAEEEKVRKEGEEKQRKAEKGSEKSPANRSADVLLFQTLLYTNRKLCFK